METSDAVNAVAASTRPSPIGDNEAQNSSSPESLEGSLTTSEFAKEFGVSVETVRRWDNTGRIEAVRTLGQHRRFPLTEVRRLRVEIMAHEMDPARYPASPTGEDEAGV